MTNATKNITETITSLAAVIKVLSEPEYTNKCNCHMECFDNNEKEDVGFDYQAIDKQAGCEYTCGRHE